MDQSPFAVAFRVAQRIVAGPVYFGRAEDFHAEMESVQRMNLPATDPPGVMLRRMNPEEPHPAAKQFRSGGLTEQWELYAQLYSPANFSGFEARLPPIDDADGDD